MIIIFNQRENEISRLVVLNMNTDLVSNSIESVEESTNIQQIIKNADTEISIIDSSSEFEFDSKTGTITEYNGNNIAVVIPSTINGVNVTSIGSGTFYGYSNLISVSIPDSVSNIGEYAFAYCSNLINITIPSNLTSIEDGTFANCGSLTSIIIPSSTTSIGYEAFSGCNCLKSMNIPKSVISIGEYAFEGCEKAVCYSNSEEIGQSLINVV